MQILLDEQSAFDGRGSCYLRHYDEYENRYVTLPLPTFLSNIKLHQLQITVLNQSHTLVKLSFLKNKVFTATVQMHFQSSFEWFLPFRTYDTRCLHFCRISN